MSSLATLVFVITMPVTTLTSIADEYHCGAADDPIAVQCYKREVKDFLQSWVIAWGNGDIDAYFDHYLPMNSPQVTMTREQWEQHRRKRLQQKEEIVVTLELTSMGIGDDGNLDVIFTQNYRDQGYADVVEKQLYLKRHGDTYKIQREVVLD